MRAICWENPPTNHFKLNTDESALGNPGHASGGGILRDYLGNVIFAFSDFFGQRTSF